MDGFRLSPGITPVLTDLAVLALPLALAVGYLAAERRGVEVALGGVTGVLGLVKLLTDWHDLLDLPVALGGLAIGGSTIATALDLRAVDRLPGPAWRAFGLLAVLVGAIKIRTDFLDPFDVELAALILALGLMVLAARGIFARFRGLPT